jgi:hypothetical protein
MYSPAYNSAPASLRDEVSSVRRYMEGNFDFPYRRRRRRTTVSSHLLPLLPLLKRNDHPVELRVSIWTYC